MSLDAGTARYFSKWRLSFLSSDMPEKERSEEEARLKEYNGKYQAGLGKIKDARAKFDIK